MNYYLDKIHINSLYHLQNLTIEIDDPNCPHLIITGKNGSGKTVLLNALTNRLEEIFPPKNSKVTVLPSQNMEATLNVSFVDPEYIVSEVEKGSFVIASYQAARKTNLHVPVNPTKPDLVSQVNIREGLSSQLLYFLSDLKIQEALARNENQIEEAEEINRWLKNFESILKSIFSDPNLSLVFQYRDYSFLINTNGKSFRFTELSDGFIAILDIVADLILRMQPKGSISTEFKRPGIVLIDEIETHLHLQLQKEIMPMLTALFPNVQFIVTTHSPFVLSSLPNATAYDLEHQEPIVNLSEYSYQALTEGYFGVSTNSDYARMRYEQLRDLLEKSELSPSERVIARQLIKEGRKIPEAGSPELVGAYRQLEIDYFDQINRLGL